MSHLPIIEKICELIKNSSETMTLQELAKTAHLSPFHFQKVFKKIVGVTPKQYQLACRKEKFKNLLKENVSVTQAIYASGHGSSSQIQDLLGMNPKSFKKGGVEQKIMVALGQCSLGSILIGQTEKGVCAIAIGDEPQQLLEQLQKDFPHANFIVGDKQFEKNVAYIIGFIDHEDKSVVFELPLDIQGTAFQKKVWNALREIPLGTTVNYSELARKIGFPQASRAVANACGSNKVAIAIPCHRVIQKNGKLSGYRWGIDRKEKLLNKEKIIS